MTHKRIAMGLALTALLAAPAAFAQDGGNLTCLYAGDGYSVGATIRMGSTAFTCEYLSDEGGAIWSAIPDEGASTNCIFADEEYGHGSVILADLEQRVCSRGIWYTKDN